MNPKQQHKSRSRIGALIVPAGLLLILGTYILFVMNQDELVTEVEDVKIEKEQLKDTIEVLHQAIDSVAAAKEEEKAIISIVSDYYRFRNFQQRDSVLALLVDTMENFYRVPNMPRSEVDKDFQRYWKKFPTSRYFLSPADMVVSRLDGKNYEVKDRHYYTQDGKTINFINSTIKVNADKKIYYTRDFIAEQSTNSL